MEKSEESEESLRRHFCPGLFERSSGTRRAREVRLVIGARLELPDEVVEEIVAQVVAVLEARAGERAAAAVSEWLTVKQAAELLCCERQRIDDLLSQRRLSRLKEGGRTLLRRAEVLALVEVQSEARASCHRVATGSENGSGSGVAR